MNEQQTNTLLETLDRIARALEGLSEVVGVSGAGKYKRKFVRINGAPLEKAADALSGAVGRCLEQRKYRRAVYFGQAVEAELVSP